MSFLRAGVLVALSLVAASCGLGDRERFARVIEAGAERAEASVAAGTLGIGWKFDLGGIPEDERERVAAQAPDATGEPLASLGVVVDGANRRGAYLRDGKVVVIHDDSILYGVRFDAAPDDARPWFKLDLEDVNEDEEPIRPDREGVLVGAELLNPAFLLDLASGPLTGSIESLGTADIDGVRVRGYEANFDLEKVMSDTRRREYPEERVELVANLFDLVAIDGPVNHGQVWLDDDGRVRRFIIELERDDDYGMQLGLVLHLELDRWGVPFDVEIPDDDALLQLDGYKQFLRGVSPSEAYATEAAPTTSTTAVAAP